MTEFEKVLAANKILVWGEIQKYLQDPIYPKAFQIPARYAEDVKLHWKIVREYPQRRGKYLRPLLLLLTARAMGAKEKNALKTAAAMQVSEDWILIHDDIEDDSLLRRGKPALHKLYGRELAINAGDTLQVIMWKILFDTYKPEIIEEFYKMLMRTTLGQSTEINWTQTDKTDLTDADWFFIADSKTCYYTIAGPMRLGAIIAGATSDQLDKLSEFGIHLGRCFQLVDDILDSTGEDIYEGKRTVMLGHLLRAVSGFDREKLRNILRKNRSGKTEEEVKWIIAKMQEYNSISYAKKLAKKEGDRALKIFKEKLGFLSQKQARNNIEMFIHFVLERQY